MGKNKQNTVYDSLELILRDAGHIDSFIKHNQSGAIVNESSSDRAARLVAAMNNQQEKIVDAI